MMNLREWKPIPKTLRVGIPPTTVRAEVSGVVINRIADDKIAEAWVVVDFLGPFQGLEIVPSIEEFAG